MKINKRIKHSSLTKKVGKKLCYLRKNYISPTPKRLTAENVYTFLGMSRSTYYNIERGVQELTLEEAVLVCGLYSITLNELIADN